MTEVKVIRSQYQYQRSRSIVLEVKVIRSWSVSEVKKNISVGSGHTKNVPGKVNVKVQGLSEVKDIRSKVSVEVQGHVYYHISIQRQADKGQ